MLLITCRNLASLGEPIEDRGKDDQQAETAAKAGQSARNRVRREIHGKGPQQGQAKKPNARHEANVLKAATAWVSNEDLGGDRWTTITGIMVWLRLMWVTEFDKNKNLKSCFRFAYVAITSVFRTWGLLVLEWKLNLGLFCLLRAFLFRWSSSKKGIFPHTLRPPGVCKRQKKVRVLKKHTQVQERCVCILWPRGEMPFIANYLTKHCNTAVIFVRVGKNARVHAALACGYHKHCRRQPITALSISPTPRRQGRCSSRR